MTPECSKKSDIGWLSISGEVGRLSVLLKFHDPGVVEKSDIRWLLTSGEVARLSVLLVFHDPGVVEKVRSAMVDDIWQSWPSVRFVGIS